MLTREVKDQQSLKFVIDALTAVREAESSRVMESVQTTARSMRHSPFLIPRVKDQRSLKFVITPRTAVREAESPGPLEALQPTSPPMRLPLF